MQHANALNRLNRLPIARFHKVTLFAVAFAYFFEFADINSFATTAPKLIKLWGDSHYGGTLQVEVQEDYGIEITVVSRPADQAGFVPLPKRWIVERTLAWLTHGRRLARDYERDPGYSEAWIYVASIHRLLQHLAPDPTVPIPYQRKAA